jgi:hypothetical protein
MGWLKRFSWIILAASLAACVDSSAVRMANNTARIDISAAPVYGGQGATNIALRLAAKETLAAGFTHFTVIDSASGYRSDLVGVIPGQGSLSGQFSNGSGSLYGQSRGPTPLIRARNGRAMVIQMLAASDPRSQSAHDAAALLAKK